MPVVALELLAVTGDENEITALPRALDALRLAPVTASACDAPSQRPATCTAAAAS